MQAAFTGPNDPFRHLGRVRRTNAVDLLIDDTVSSRQRPLMPDLGPAEGHHGDAPLFAVRSFI
jgi:hypothetical protein